MTTGQIGVYVAYVIKNRILSAAHDHVLVFMWDIKSDLCILMPVKIRLLKYGKRRQREVDLGDGVKKDCRIMIRDSPEFYEVFPIIISLQRLHQ